MNVPHNTDKVTQAEAMDSVDEIINKVTDQCLPILMDEIRAIRQFIAQHPDEPAKTSEQERIDRINRFLDAATESVLKRHPNVVAVIDADGLIKLQTGPQP